MAGLDLVVDQADARVLPPAAWSVSVLTDSSDDGTAHDAALTCELGMRRVLVHQSRGHRAVESHRGAAFQPVLVSDSDRSSHTGENRAGAAQMSRRGLPRTRKFSKSSLLLVFRFVFVVLLGVEF